MNSLPAFSLQPPAPSPQSQAPSPKPPVPSPQSSRAPAPAFTLTELLVVIVVIAILMAIALPLTRYATRRAKEAKHEVMMNQMRSALDEYRSVYGEYPITPETNNSGNVMNEADVMRHYPRSCATFCNQTTNSPYTNVYLIESNLVETIDSRRVDYSLTYPLMLRQIEHDTEPLMNFDVIAVQYRVDDATDQMAIKKSKIKWRKKNGGYAEAYSLGVEGRAILRAKAVDPISGRQWKYSCFNGINYTLTTNIFN